MPETLQRPSLASKSTSEGKGDLLVRLAAALQSGVVAFVDQWKRTVVEADKGEAAPMTKLDYDYFVAQQKITEMRDLQPGWNSYRAGRIGDDARAGAIRLLEILRTNNTPAPEVGPTPDGGVQLAWSLPSKRGQLELEVTLLDNEGEYSFGYRDEDGFIAEGRVKDLEVVASKLQEAMNSAAAA